MTAQTTSPSVTYTVKELLAQLHDKVDGLAGKVDKIDERLAIREYEAERTERRGEKRTDHYRWLVMAACSLVVALGTMLAVLH
jgi:anti-sigma-K factor RskA